MTIEPLRGGELRAALSSICAVPMPLMPEDFEHGATMPLAGRLTPAQRLHKERREKDKRDRAREKYRPEGCITTSEAAKLARKGSAWIVQRCKKLCVESALTHNATNFWRRTDLVRAGILGKVS